MPNSTHEIPTPDSDRVEKFGTEKEETAKSGVDLASDRPEGEKQNSSLGDGSTPKNGSIMDQAIVDVDSSSSNDLQEMTMDEKRYAADQQAHLPHVEGVQLWTLVTVLGLGLLMSSLETTIIGTALISIASELGDYARSAWVVAAYLITYTGFLIIFARCSDIFGRRSAFMVALVIFTGFSLACGLAQTMSQLIVFRAFQGVGGGGLYSLAMGIATEVPGPVRAPINGILSSTFAISSAIGPLIGGAIASRSSWRWVFLLNCASVPVGVVLLGVAFWMFPKNSVPLNINLRSFRRLDFPGIALSLGAIICMVYSLQQGGLVLAWGSAPIISTLTVSGVCWVVFVAWEVYLTRLGKRSVMLPVWPARLFAGRVIGSAMLTSFLSGLPFMTIIIYLPQRFQLENGLSPVDAGVRMMAYLLVSSFAAGIASVVYVMKNVLFPFIVVATALQVLGLGLMSSLAPTGDIQPEQYAYQVILGLGFGISLSSLPLIARLQVGPEDHAVNMGAITQIRILGGVIGVGVGEVILSSKVWSALGGILADDEVEQLLQSTGNIVKFTDAQAAAIRLSYGEAFNLQFRVMTYITLVCFIICLGCWVKNPIEIKDMEKIETKRREDKIAENKRKRDEEKQHESAGDSAVLSSSSS